MSIKVAESEYIYHVDADSGYCTVCEDFTRDCCEPDAEGYPCPDCGNDSVMGTEQALLCGELEIVDDFKG